MIKPWMKLATASLLVWGYASTGCALVAEDSYLDGVSPGSGGSDGGADDGEFSFDPGEHDNNGCNEITVEFERQIPTVLLLIDRSGSMFDNAYGSSPDRWQPLYDVLVDTGNGIVTQMDGDVRFGLATYTNDGHSQTCPSMSEVAPKLNNYSAIKSAYDIASSKPGFKAETPTGPAVLRATETLEQMNVPGPKYIVLATDGEPDTCGHPDPQCGQDDSITAVQDAYAQGIGTIVIGLGNEVGAKHLSDLANAGDGQSVAQPDKNWEYNCQNTGLSGKNASYSAKGGDATYYRPADQAQLETDLHGIISGVRDCVFELKAKVDTDQAHLCKVELDGEPLNYSAAWKLKTETELEVTGVSCEKLKTNSDKLHIDCPCDIVAPL